MAPQLVEKVVYVNMDALEEEGSRDCADPPTAPKPTE